MMAEEPDLAKFRNTCSTVPTEGIASYDIKLTQTKKRNPVFSQTLSKQHTTFDEEIKRALQGPDPARFEINEKQTKLARFEQRSLGLDIKANQKLIKMTPGPGEYQYMDSQRSSTKNHGLKYGWSSSDPRYTSKTFEAHNTGDNT